MVVKEYYLVMYGGGQEIIEIKEKYKESFNFIRDFNIDDKLLLRVNDDESFEVMYYKGDDIEKIQIEIPSNNHLLGKIIQSMKDIAVSKSKSFKLYEYDVSVDEQNKIHHKWISGS